MECRYSPVFRAACSMALLAASCRARTASGDFRSITSPHCEHRMLGLLSPTVVGIAMLHFEHLTENRAHSIAILSGAMRTSILPGTAGWYTRVRHSAGDRHHTVPG